jgi:lactococcin 972 family bacteriocin
MKKILTTAASAAAALALAGALLVPAGADASEPAAAPVPVAAPAPGAHVDAITTWGGVSMPAGDNTPQYGAHPEGGTWSHGTNDGVYSNYYHPSKRHGSTAMNGRGNSNRVTGIASGSWSYASISKTTAGNSAYWHLN